MKFEIDAGNRCGSHPAQAQLTPDHRSSKSSRVVAEKLDTANPRLLSRPCRWFGLPPLPQPLALGPAIWQRLRLGAARNRQLTPPDFNFAGKASDRPCRGPISLHPRRYAQCRLPRPRPWQQPRNTAESAQISRPRYQPVPAPGHQLLGHRSSCRNTSAGYLLGEEPHRDRRFVPALGSSVCAPCFFMRPKSCQ